MAVPPPPRTLATYVGERANQDPVASYLEGGAAYAAHLLRALPDGFDLEGAHVLDFGCGSGRLMRHMVDAETGAVVEGCDIHRPSIEWYARHVKAPHEVFLTDEMPPLPRPDGHYRLIYATSVFTHLSESWSAWLVEMHRLLEDGGLLMATHIGPAYAAVFDEEPWDDDRIGMLVLLPFNPWADGGPMVLHSEWWVRAHWGRCFELLSFERDGFGNSPGVPGTQGLMVLRKRPVTITAADLELLEPGEARELTALQHALDRSHMEIREIAIRYEQLRDSKLVRASRPLRMLWHRAQRLGRRSGTSAAG